MLAGELAPVARAALVDGDAALDAFMVRLFQPVQPMLAQSAETLGEALDEQTWTVRVHVKPFVDWIWGGAFLMALGGALAVADRRYRRVAPREQPALAVQRGAAA
jgi:hypothetical protein